MVDKDDNRTSYRPCAGTYGYLLPVADTPPIYFTGPTKGVILSDNSDSIPAAWQCEQDGDGVTYRVGSENGECRKCNPGRLYGDSFSGGYVREEYCCDKRNSNTCFCRGCTRDPGANHAVDSCDECS